MDFIFRPLAVLTEGSTLAKQKQLPVQRLPTVRTCLALATLSVQIAIIANSIWQLPHRNISEMATAFQ